MSDSLNFANVKRTQRPTKCDLNQMASRLFLAISLLAILLAQAVRHL